jgi:indole-3-glycerol phosphate synthase
LESVRQQAAAVPRPVPFREALLAAPLGLIAEIKRRSPSKGDIRAGLDPAEMARCYQQAGAQAISCLMDEPFFGGGEDDFRAARAACTLPMLYKEFVVDPWQVWHAASIGASAVLLIAAALKRSVLDDLIAAADDAGLEVLLEVHSREELLAVKDCPVACIGINNRNLKTFEVTLATTLSLLADVPEGVAVISESGIHGPDDVARLFEAGIQGLLVGEHLLRQADVAKAIQELMKPAWSPTS